MSHPENDKIFDRLYEELEMFKEDFSDLMGVPANCWDIENFKNDWWETNYPGERL
jgi:hypothetical protein